MGNERIPKKERNKTKLKTNKKWTTLSCFEEVSWGSDHHFTKERNEDQTRQDFWRPSRIRCAKLRDRTTWGGGEGTEERLTEEEERLTEEEISEGVFFTCFSVVCVRFQRPHLSYQCQVLSCFLRLEVPFVGLTLVQPLVVVGVEGTVSFPESWSTSGQSLMMWSSCQTWNKQECYLSCSTPLISFNEFVISVRH